jgi:hypothetical protein
MELPKISLNFEQTGLCLAGLTFLFSLIWLTWRLRHSKKLPKNKQDWPHLGGRALDTTALQPQLDEVRRNYSAAPRVSSSPRRAKLLAQARRVVTKLGYFNTATSETETRDHTQAGGRA